MTNNIHFVDEISLQDPIGKIDHVVFNIFVIAKTENEIPIERRLYYKGDYDSMRKYFKSIDWNYLLFNKKNAQDSWNLFYDHFCFPFVPVFLTSLFISTRRNGLILM